MAKRPSTKQAATGGRTVVTYDIDGRRTERPYTPEEEAEADRMKAAWDGRVPSSATAHQIRIALVRAKKLDAVNKAMAAAGGEAAVTWEYGTTIARHGSVGDALDALLGGPAVDEVFRAAQEVLA